jgi:hypothetical protein
LRRRKLAKACASLVAPPQVVVRGAQSASHTAMCHTQSPCTTHSSSAGFLQALDPGHRDSIAPPHPHNHICLFDGRQAACADILICVTNLCRLVHSLKSKTFDDEMKDFVVKCSSLYYRIEYYFHEHHRASGGHPVSQYSRTLVIII